jgi:hypothetical protein
MKLDRSFPFTTVANRFVSLTPSSQIRNEIPVAYSQREHVMLSQVNYRRFHWALIAAMPVKKDYSMESVFVNAEPYIAK